MGLTRIAFALVAALAMSALVASSASAQPLTSNVSPVSLSGNSSGNQEFTVDGQSVKCTSATISTGSISTPANEINGVTASYSGCTAFGFAGATVNMGNCTTSIHTPTKIVTDEYTETLGTFCSGATNANINSSVFGSECSVSIGQTGNENVSHAIAHNTTNNVPRDLTITTTTTGTRVVKNKDNGLCPLSGTGTVNNGTHNGTYTVFANNGNDIWLE